MAYINPMFEWQICFFSSGVSIEINDFQFFEWLFACIHLGIHAIQFSAPTQPRIIDVKSRLSQ